MTALLAAYRRWRVRREITRVREATQAAATFHRLRAHRLTQE